MDKWTISPSSLKGNLFIPPSKSHTLRSLLFAALGEGTSLIHNPLSSPDTEAMLRAISSLGAKIQKKGKSILIEGMGGNFQAVDDVIDCGNSGQVLRFIGAIAGLIPHYTILTGDSSIRHLRPAAPLVEGLQQLGVWAESSRGDGKAPLLIRGPITGSQATIDGKDSQPVSGLLIVSSLAPHPIELFVKDPKETPWIDLTLDWLSRLNLPFERKGYTYYRLRGKGKIAPFTYTVPGDLSSAAFPVIAALITQSEITLSSIDLEDIQGDRIVFSLLQKMGARLHFDREKKTLRVEKSPPLKGMVIDLDQCIDALPILAVLGCFTETPIELVNGKIARQKESNRIDAIEEELKKMGAKIQTKEDGMVIFPSSLNGASLCSHDDHRIAMSLAVAALGAKGSSTLFGTGCTRKTFPHFFSQFSQLGALFQ